MDERMYCRGFAWGCITGLLVLSFALSCGERNPRGSAVVRVPVGTFVATSPNASVLGASNRVTTIDTTTTSLGELITQVGAKRADAGGGFVYYIDGTYSGVPADKYALQPGTHRITWYYVPPGEDGRDLIVQKKEPSLFEFVVEVQ